MLSAYSGKRPLVNCLLILLTGPFPCVPGPPPIPTGRRRRRRRGQRREDEGKQLAFKSAALVARQVMGHASDKVGGTYD